MTKTIYLVLATLFLTQFPHQENKQSTLNGTPVKIFTTAKNTQLRLSEENSSQFDDASPITEKKAYIFLDDTHTFQTMLGIGGAITDASAEVFAKLTPELQKEILTAYYSIDNGIGYTLARTNIQSCDFSSDSYAYVQKDDKDLKTFSIAHDEKYKIPLIKKAMNAAGHLNLFVTPWSPPAWMKTNNNMLLGGKLLPAYMEAWANMYIKFIQAYEQRDIPVWGLSVQNEPMAVQKWESCIYTAEDERDFIKNFLGPALVKNGMKDKKLIAWDHNRDLIYHRASTVLNDPEAARYVWGIGFHWYETWTGGKMQFDNVKMVHQTFPDKNLIFTEGCAESFHKDRMSSWDLGEVYGKSMIHDFNSGTVAWTDWNILLDERGGPNHVGNFCFAPVHSLKGKQLFYTNSFYYIGHFSKYIKPGAKRINASSNRTNLLSTAFKNPDGSIAVVIMNDSDSILHYNLMMDGQSAPATSYPHSISTLLFQK